MRSLSGQFLKEKQFLAVRGAVVSEELSVSIAAQACLPVLNLGLTWYGDWSTLMLAPDEFTIEQSISDPAGVIHEYDDTVGGQILPLGSIVLSLADVDASGWCEGYNVVIHEMAHALDRRNGALDGAPPLHDTMDGNRWKQSFTEAYDDFLSRVSTKKGRRRSKIDPYAAEGPEEFFAVVSEVFFEQPWILEKEYHSVYEELAAFYRQDPGKRLPESVRRRLC